MKQTKIPAVQKFSLLLELEVIKIHQRSHVCHYTKYQLTIMSLYISLKLVIEIIEHYLFKKLAIYVLSVITCLRSAM